MATFGSYRLLAGHRLVSFYFNMASVVRNKLTQQGMVKKLSLTNFIVIVVTFKRFKI